MLEARIVQAVWSTENLGLDATVAVDSMDNHTWQVFGSAPSPAYAIDSNGTIVLRQVWVNPSEIRDVLRGMLASPLRTSTILQRGPRAVSTYFSAPSFRLMAFGIVTRLGDAGAAAA